MIDANNPEAVAKYEAQAAYCWWKEALMVYGIGCLLAFGSLAGRPYFNRAMNEIFKDKREIAR